LQHATASNGGVTDDSSKRDEKYELWKALTAAAFARAVATAWSLPLLQLFVKAQLNVLGRHLFLESQIKESEVAEAEGGPTFGPGVGLTRDSSTNSFAYELPSKLTLRCQQKFLSYAEFLSQHGIETIVHEARNAATRVLKDVDLRKPCSENHFRGLLARLSATLEDVASTKGWARLLLPQIGGIGGGATGGAQSPTGAWRFLVTQGTELGLTTSVDAVLDEGDLQVLEALLNETRRVLSTRAFDEAVRCSAAQTLRMVGGNAAASVYTVGNTMDPGSERDEMGEMGENGVPAAKLVPAVAAAALRVLDQPGETISAVAALPEVEALCARVYDVTGTVGRW
jgi:peroxin-3